uniref:hypothetical protein n=1 Tax=Algoriphagus locisalis TaxID=305507 RepID=UPI001FCE2D77|nr:hypothetical protein [Algoriphagus locisalis]
MNRKIAVDIRKMPNVNTSLVELNLPNEKLGALKLDPFFLVGSPFFLKVLVLGELVAMYAIQIRFKIRLMKLD